jgi:hypothetical protein
MLMRRCPLLLTTAHPLLTLAHPALPIKQPCSPFRTETDFVQVRIQVKQPDVMNHFVSSSIDNIQSTASLSPTNASHLYF